MYVKSKDFRLMLNEVLSNLTLDSIELPLFNFSDILDYDNYNKLQQLKIREDDLRINNGQLMLSNVVQSTKPFIIFTRDNVVNVKSETFLHELNFNIGNEDLIKLRTTFNCLDVLMDRFRRMDANNNQHSLVLRANRGKIFRNDTEKEKLISQLDSMTKLKNPTHYILLLEIFQSTGDGLMFQFSEVGDTQLDYESVDSLINYCNRHGVTIIKQKLLS